MNTVNIKDYLKVVYELEKSLYQQESLATEMWDKAGRIKYDKKLVNAMNTNTSMISGPLTEDNFWFAYGLEDDSPYERTQSLAIKSSLSTNVDGGVIGGFAFLGLIVAFIVFVIKIVQSYYIDLHYIFRGEFWTDLFSSIGTGLLFGAIVFAVCLIIYLAVKISKTSNENSEIKQKNKQIQLNNNRIISSNNQKYKERQVLRENLIKEYNYLEDTSIVETKLALDKIYSLNIIYPKYHHNFVAIASLYEYFASGRCQTLGEAYNKYEEELRLNLIISKLDTIIKKLDEIKQNQFMLYDAINKSNETNRQLLSQIKKIQNQNEDILNNSSIVAYNSSIISQNSEFLKWYAIFKG